MIEIKEVKTRKQRAKFVDFPTKLYKNCKYYVHPLRIDEMNLFNRKKNASFDDCDAIYFLAYKDNVLVGRIAGILQRLYNEKTKEKRVRFSRFDCIDDEEVAKALFNAVENWAIQKGMNKVHGPLGFNDLDREGLLIEGFNYLSTFEEQYNYEYYPKLIENCGYGKEIDWLEFRIYPPKEVNERVQRLSDAVLKRYNLKIVNEKSKRKYINKYKKGIFDVLDEAYSSLYGVVPFNDKLRDQIISQFKLFIKLRYVITIVDENDKVAAFGFAIPSISDAVRKSKGRFLPFGFIRMLYATRHNKQADLGLIGVRDAYQNKGLPAVVLNFIINNMVKEKLEYCETNLMLEDNLRIQQTWKNFKHIQHKLRRSYIKELGKSEEKAKSEKEVKKLSEKVSEKKGEKSKKISEKKIEKSVKKSPKISLKKSEKVSKSLTEKSPEKAKETLTKSSEKTKKKSSEKVLKKPAKKLANKVSKEKR